MINGELAVRISRISSDLMLDYYSPNQDLLKKVSSFNVNDLDTINDVILSKFILVLGQFLVFINHNENLLKVKSIALEKDFDKFVMREIGKGIWRTGTTLKEKISTVVFECEALSALEKEKDIVKCELQMYQGTYNTILEYMNAYKREQGRRSVGDQRVRNEG